MRLALDHHYSRRIAEELHTRDHDVVAAVERGWEQLDDATLLARCADERRALLTNNVADLATIAREWSAEARSHAGLLFTSDSSLPRGRATIGRFVELLDELLGAHPADDAFVDRIGWLPPTGSRS